MAGEEPRSGYGPDDGVRREADQGRASVEEQINGEIVLIFTELLQRLWDRLVALVGEAGTAAMFYSALRDAAGEHPFLKHIEVSEDEIRLEGLRENLASLDRTTLRRAFLAYIDGIVALLIDLTGDILVRKVQPLITEFHEALSNGKEA